MRPDLVQFAPPLLALAGAAYQWIRQYRGVKEQWTYVYAGVLALTVYLLCYDYKAPHDPQLAIIFSLLWVGGNVATVLGGTFMASGADRKSVV